MKIKAEVLSVESTGDALRVRLQGSAATDAEWRPLLASSIEIPDTQKNRRAYHVGRSVSLTVEAL